MAAARALISLHPSPCRMAIVVAEPIDSWYDHLERLKPVIFLCLLKFYISLFKWWGDYFLFRTQLSRYRVAFGSTASGKRKRKHFSWRRKFHRWSSFLNDQRKCLTKSRLLNWLIGYVSRRSFLIIFSYTVGNSFSYLFHKKYEKHDSINRRFNLIIWTYFPAFQKKIRMKNLVVQILFQLWRSVKLFIIARWFI